MPQPVISPRDLVLRHGKYENKPIVPQEITPKPDIGESSQKLHSFDRPGLTAGSYAINVKQEITRKLDGTDLLDDSTSVKRSTGLAPQYNLPPGSINSVHPPNGHTASHVTLPHVVLNDAHLPWERVGSEDELLTGGDLGKNRTPWLAVLVFTHDEIALPVDAMAQLNDLLKPSNPFEASPTSSINVNISSFAKQMDGNDTFSSPLTFNKDLDDLATVGDVVIVKKDLLAGLLRTYKDDGSADSDQRKHDVSRYRWLSHVRHVDTTSMVEAGSTTGLLGEKDTSVVLSHRTGPLRTEEPTPVVAHLVSIQGLEGMPYPFKTDYIALSSLHSWSYTSLPPNSITDHHAVKNIGNSKGLLRAPTTTKELDTLVGQGDAGKTIANRLQDGYTIVRYRTQTGESTSAFYRGPLTPTNVKYPLRADWGDPSMNGTDRQIFDGQIGMMDISYSTAWQLGKTLALADRSFTIALARVRKQIQDARVEEKKKDEVEKDTPFKTKLEAMKSLVASMKTIEDLPQSDASHAPSRPDISFQNPSEDDDGNELQNQLNRAAEKISGMLDDASVPYDEFNTPYSTDWAVVIKWILDRMYLVGIPPQHLITDISHLPQETIRFFAIDRNWIDALIDGALSLANHLDRSDDRVRRAIQHAIKRYLDTSSKGLGRRPPVPLYGFLLRSELVTKFPDMVITTEPSQPKDVQQKPILIRRELLDANVIICLFDRLPKKDGFDSITLGQPCHQRSFSIGSQLDNENLGIELKGVYTGDAKDQPTGNDSVRNLPSATFKWTRGEEATEDKSAVFVWGDGESNMRFMLPNNFSKFLHRKVRQGVNEDERVNYAEPEPTARLMANQLNDLNWQLKIVFGEDDKIIPEDSKSAPPSPAGGTRATGLEQEAAAEVTSTWPCTERRTLLSTGGFEGI